MPVIPTKELFWANVPREYMRKLFRGLLQVYPDVYSYVRKTHEEPEAVNVDPFELRARVQRMLRDVAVLFPQSVSVEVSHGEPTPSWWSHSRAQCGPVILIANTADSPEEVIEASGCRRQYAESTYHQRCLFEEMDEADEVSADQLEAMLFGMLLHGKGLEKSGTLGFAVIRFPNRDLAGYQDCRIDLFKEFPDVVENFRRGHNNADDDDGLQFLEGEDIV